MGSFVQREDCLFSLWKGFHCKLLQNGFAMESLVQMDLNEVFCTKKLQWNPLYKGFTMESFA